MRRPLDDEYWGPGDIPLQLDVVFIMGVVLILAAPVSMAFYPGFYTLWMWVLVPFGALCIFEGFLEVKRLVAERRSRCGETARFPTAEACPSCGAPLEWVPAAGRRYCSAERVYV
jgi:hypothetical protein